ncbi:hypothetical protein SMICM17S_10264 [Streptomyces microflavus]
MLGIVAIVITIVALVIPVLAPLAVIGGLLLGSGGVWE